MFTKKIFWRIFFFLFFFNINGQNFSCSKRENSRGRQIKPRQIRSFSVIRVEWERPTFEFYDWTLKIISIKKSRRRRSKRNFRRIENLSSNDWPNINSIDFIDLVFPLCTKSNLDCRFSISNDLNLLVRNRVDSKLLGETFFINRQCEKFSFKWFSFFLFSQT